MKIQNFIFCWNEYVSHALVLEHRLSPLGKTTVINSNTDFRPDRWINLDDAYFAEQWNTLLNHIDDDTDYVFHIQADASCGDFYNLFLNFNRTIFQYPVGLYAPNVDYSTYKFSFDDLQALNLFLYEVPVTDSTCWFINTKLMERRPFFDVTRHSMGWGVDLYYAAIADMKGLKVLRDYNVTVDHPRGSNYNQTRALEQFTTWLFEQDEEMFMRISRKFSFNLVYQPLIK